VVRGAVLAGLVAFFLLASAQTFDQPRPRGAEIAREQAPPQAVGCPRETLVRFSVMDAWLRELPLGGILAGVAARRLVGSCSAGF
jgi:hypothetical protein